MPKKTEEKKDSVKEEGTVRKAATATKGFLKKHRTKFTIGGLTVLSAALGMNNVGLRGELEEARRSKDDSDYNDGPTLEVVDEIA